MQLIIDTANTSLSVRSKLFYIENNTTQRHISPKRVTSIAITTNCNINSSVIKIAAQNQIPIYFFNHFGTIQARTCSPYFTNLASLRKKQLLFYDTPEATQWVIIQLTRKAQYQIINLQRLSKNKSIARKEFVQRQIEVIETQIKNLVSYKESIIDVCRNNLMGIEGNCSKHYYRALSVLLPKEYQFVKRSRRPATDFFNAALNYLYGMTYSVVESGVFAKGLDPFIGYLHTENYQKTALVFDLIEPIRPLIDRILIDICVNKQLKETHFIKKEQGFWLNKEGKKIIIPTFNDYLYKRIEVDGRIRRLKDIIYLESFELGRLIEKHSATTE